MKLIFQLIKNDIFQNLNIDLSLNRQEPINSHIERQVKYLCEDLTTGKKYLLIIAMSKAQIHFLKQSVKNINILSKKWCSFFSFNMPVISSQIDKVYYCLYEYFENAKKATKNDSYFEKFLEKLYKSKSYTVSVTEEVVDNIMQKLITERCEDDDITRLNYSNTKEYKNLAEILHKYSKLTLCRTFGDAKNSNILINQDRQYLIGHEYGNIDLPIGFDLYCLRRASGSTNFEDIPYVELHECLYKIHHVGNNAEWLRYHNPIVKIDKENRFIKIRECSKTTTIFIKRRIPLYNFDLIIDFENIEISPAATYKLVNLIKGRFKSNYTITFKNCPFWFEGLEQDGENLLSFTGVINKKTIIPKNFKEWIMSTQAYVNYSRILPYVKPYWFRALLAVVICIPIGSLDAVIALSLKPYMDLVMVEKTVQSPWYIPFGIVAFTCIQGLLNYIATYLNTWVGGKITNDLKFELYKKMLTFETAYFDKKKSGDIVYRFNNDADTACAGLLDNLKTFVSRLFSSLSLIAVLFYNSWQLALIAIVVLGCAFLPIARIQKRIKSVIDKSVSVTSAAISAYNESFAGNKTITSYNLEKHQENNFKSILNNIFNLKIKLVQRTSWLSPMMHIIVSVGIGLAIGYGSHLIITKQITSGNFVSFITALIMLYTPIKNLGNNLNAVQFSFLAIERVFSILNMKPKILDSENPVGMSTIKENIIFKDVNFEYVKNKPVLKHINLDIKKGSTVAFVGNSGGGKSTIVSLLPRFYDIKSGTILIDGIDIKDYSLKSLRQNIAVVFQDNFLFSGTIKENIMLGNENATEEDMQKAIKMAYLEDFINELSKGVDTQIGERGVLLSGGQKQRVAIARAFLKDAPVVILDEATSALDNKAEAVVQKAIENLMKDKTVFVIAHRLSTIQNADKIVVINQGEIVETGTHNELLNIQNGAYKTLYEMQFKKQEVNI